MKSIFATVTVLSAFFIGAQGLDLELRKVTCDESLPAYINSDDVSWECSGGGTQCTMGDTAIISGGITYNNLASYTGYNSTGYATSTLNLLSLEYELFELLPFNFCGDWIKTGNGYYSNSSCPYDGYYHFDLQYSLPSNAGHTTWFASGWTATSEIMIFNTRTSGASVLADCLLEFHTSVTPSKFTSGDDGWKAVPSAAAVALSLLGIAIFMCMIICCLACRTRKKRVTDRDFDESDFVKMADDATADDSTVEGRETALQTARKLGKKMRYGTPGEAAWS